MESNAVDSITLVNAGVGYQYSINGGKTWQNSPEFTALDRNTEYSFVQRSGEGAPVSAAAAFSTLPGKPGESELQIDYVNETFTLANGVTAYSDDTCAEVIGGNDRTAPSPTTSAKQSISSTTMWRLPITRTKLSRRFQFRAAPQRRR